MKRCKVGTRRVDGACKRKSTRTLGDPGQSGGFPWTKVIIGTAAAYVGVTVVLPILGFGVLAAGAVAAEAAQKREFDASTQGMAARLRAQQQASPQKNPNQNFEQ